MFSVENVVFDNCEVVRVGSVDLKDAVSLFGFVCAYQVISLQQKNE